ncbi:MAG: uracil-DNA glycosylase, partial [Planctomycetota bacterium]|nr:uracil-DNA glycosylase [Planctomycetota bacterium]
MVKKNGKDPLGLTELFQGGGEEWLSLLKKTIEAQGAAEDFVGPERGSGVVPVRELMFQALKPNPPEKWNVVVFGQNPYPRVESATGIAMFDNTFNEWKDSKFGRVVSMRCIIKAACIWKYEIDNKTRVGDIRKLLAKEEIVPPPEWFQAILTQGVLLLNAALTASGDGAMSTSQHTSFWRPVVEKIVEEILKAKQSAGSENKGVVFLWWGSHAKTLKKMVQRLEKKYNTVPVKHIEHCNPAAQGDMFCKGNHFADVNKMLTTLQMNEIDWLPEKGWNDGDSAELANADQMGDFIAKTMELHKVYLERLQSVKDEGKKELSPITGVFDAPVLEFTEALSSVVKLFKSLAPTIKRSKAFGEKLVKIKKAGALSVDEVASLYLYTCQSVFYRKLNASLRMSQRSKVKPYIPYLKLLF